MKFSSVIKSSFFVSSILLYAIRASEPKVQMNLSNWYNNTTQVIHLFSCGATPFGVKNYLQADNCVHFEKLTPGYNGCLISIPIKDNGEESFSLKAFRLVPEDNLQSCVQLYFACLSLNGKSKLNVSCTANYMKSGHEEMGLTLAQQEINWDTKNPPSYITIDIEGVMGGRWNDAHVAIKPHIVN